MKEGTWPQFCLQRAFVEGAKWWQFHTQKATMFSSERDEAEAEAVRQYGEPKPDSDIQVKFTELSIHLRNRLDSKGLDLLAEALVDVTNALINIGIADLEKGENE